MVEAFLREEANVSYCARNITNHEYDDFYTSLPESNAARAVGTAVDVSQEEALKEWVDGSAKRFGRLDVVIANGTRPSFLQKLFS